MEPLGCHFSRDDFLGIFRFFDFNRLPSKLAMNLVVPSLSLMCIFLPAFWPSSAQSLVLSACDGLKPACLGISRGAVAMLQEFLRRGTKNWADKPGSNFREGSSAKLGICSRPVWGSAYGGKSAKRPPWKWWILRWIFAVDFWSQNTKEKSAEKIRRKIRQPKTKIRPRTTPPKSASQAQKSAAKPTNKSACQTSKYTPGFFD